MLKFNDLQIQEIEASVELNFIKRIENIIRLDYTTLIEEIADIEVKTTIITCLNEARSIHIENEKDIFDYTLLRLEHNCNILLVKETQSLLKWLSSEYVPSHRKNEELKSVLSQGNKEYKNV